jgi:hypothetical protein
MTDDQLAKELHELKRRRETPLPLIEMFGALLSLSPPELSAKHKRKRSDEIIATALKRLERKGRLTATGGWRGRQRTRLTTGRDNRSRVASAARLRPVWQPHRRHGRDRDRAAIARSTPD